MTISFFVPGVPAPGGSKAFKGFYNKTTASGVVVKIPLLADSCKNNAPWRQSVQVFARQAYTGEPLACPVDMQITFYRTRPKNHFNSKGEIKTNAPKFPTGKPDTTKLTRALEDALKGILWRDDSQVVTQHVRKRYDAIPGAHVIIAEATDPYDVLSALAIAKEAGR
jgi:Holliday junction resolvase RusA-like endonuclease